MADSAPIDKLTPRQQKALIALLGSASIAKAAAESDIPERTIHAWLRDPDFEAAYRQARRDAVRAATAALQRASGAAVTVIAQLMVNTSTPPAVRLAAASKVLELAIASVELDDVLARLAALEAKQV